MSNPTATPEPYVQLAPARVDEIRLLPARLTAGLPEDAAEARELLAECRTALRELLADRDDLVRANTAAGEDLAAWLGAI